MEKKQRRAAGSSKKTSKKKTTTPLVLGIFVILVAFIVGAFAIVKFEIRNQSEHPFVLSVARATGAPAAKINDDIIRYDDYIADLETLRSFFDENPEQLIDTTREDIPKQVMTRLLINEVVRQVADTFEISVSDEELESGLQEMEDQLGTEDNIEDVVKETFGWDFDLYVNRVVRPLLLQIKLQDAFSDQVSASHILFAADPEDPEVYEEIRSEAEAVLERAKAGEDFAALAAEYGSDGTKDVGGELGWFGKGVMVPEFEAVAFTLAPGHIADQLVETEYGFHILKVNETRKGLTEDGADFDAYIRDQIEQADVTMYINMDNPLASLFADDMTG